MRRQVERARCGRWCVEWAPANGSLQGVRLDRNKVKQAGLWLGPALGALCYLLLSGTGLTSGGQATAATAVWMACWWLTEALPLAATALLPLVLLPLGGAASIDEVAAPYASSLIFLFMGGFIIGLAIQRVGLHQRLALHLLLRVGPSPRRLVGGFMLACAGLSMWISNTATAIMMLPIGVSVLGVIDERSGLSEAGARALGTSLVLGIAYACSIGGMATLIGTPPNLVLAAFLRERYGTDLAMADWLKIGLPLALVLLPLTWWYLTRIAFPVPAGALPGGRRAIAQRLEALGPISSGERRVLAVFALTAVGWILRPQLAAWLGLPALDDTVIATLAALTLFVLPLDRASGRLAMDWETAKGLPWEILILFGGGLSLASAIAENGVDALIATAFVAFRVRRRW